MPNYQIGVTIGCRNRPLHVLKAVALTWHRLGASRINIVNTAELAIEPNIPNCEVLNVPMSEWRPGLVRNIGIMELWTPYIITANADIIPVNMDIQKLAERLSAGGKIYYGPPDDYYWMTPEQSHSTVNDILLGALPSQVPDASWRKEEPIPCIQEGAFLMARRETLFDAGLYNNRMRNWGIEDTEFGIRLQRLYHVRRLTPPGELWHCWHEQAACGGRNDESVAEMNRMLAQFGLKR